MGGLIGELIDLLIGKLCYEEGKEKIDRKNDDCERVCRDRANNHQRNTISGHYRAEYGRTCTEELGDPSIGFQRYTKLTAMRRIVKL